MIPKKSGDLRVILNLKEFNLFISTQHFRMETLNVILPQLSASDWAVSIDLKDAYLHIPVHPQSRRFLGFQFMDMTYQYKVLPFGLKDSPWVFTRVVATLVGHLRRLGIRVFYYLDDWLLVAESKELLELHLQTTLLWTQDLGFLVNWKKSSLVPQRLPAYLGAQLDIPNLLARPLEHRVLALQSVIQDLTSGWLASALLWQKFLGHLASFVDLVPNCRMLMRPLQLHFLRYFTPLTDPQDKLVPLSPEVKVLCRAWASPSRLLEGKLFAPPPHRLVISTDASGQGWGGGGAVLHPHRVSGVWSKAEAVRFGAQFSAPEVLLLVPGAGSCLEDTRAVVSLGESSSVRVSSFLSSPQDLGKDCSGQSGPSPGCPVLASETLVPSAPSCFGRFPKMLPVQKDLVVQPLSQFFHPRVKSLHLSLWPLSGSRVKKQAFLKELRSSQLKQSDNPLATLMIPDWTVSGSGVPRSLAIPLLPL